MGAKFGDVDEFFSPGLTLTVRGAEYVVPLASGELGLWCRRAAEFAGTISAASSEEEMAAAVEVAEQMPPLPGSKSVTLEERVLGDVYQQMLADEVPDPYIQFCGQTAYVWIIAGEETAERFWTSGGRLKAESPTNRQERRATAKTSGGAGNGTRSRASTSGTRSRKASAPAKASPGPRS